MGSPAVWRISTFGDNFAAAGISSHCLAGVVGLSPLPSCSCTAYSRLLLPIGGLEDVRYWCERQAYSCLASTASRARSSFAVIAAGLAAAANSRHS